LVKLEVDSGEPKAGFSVVITDQSRKFDHDVGLVGGWVFLLQCLPIVPWLLCTVRQWVGGVRERESEKRGCVLFVGCESVNLLICSCLIESHLGVKKNQWRGMCGEGETEE
jgi:hypothetical protein